MIQRSFVKVFMYIYEKFIVAGFLVVRYIKR